MKVIELLNKIANGEEVPRKIKYRKNIYKYNNQYNNYYLENKSICGLHSLFNYLCTDGDLNEKIEILEIIEDKPEKIEKIKINDKYIEYFEKDETRHYMNINRKDRNIYIPKINEVIDKLNCLLEQRDSK